MKFIDKIEEPKVEVDSTVEAVTDTNNNNTILYVGIGVVVVLVAAFFIMKAKKLYMRSKISKILITVGLLICVGSLSIKGYSKYLENKSTKSFEEKIDKNANINLLYINVDKKYEVAINSKLKRMSD